MYQLKETDYFSKWLSNIRDMRALARVFTRLENLRQGNFGDTKSLKGGLHELRVHTGKGYRLYYTKRGNKVIFLLAGGTKSGQAKDIERARELLSELRS
ncbi:MAG: type II toxin-antitoxin system RelE/ParE family toxin [Gammaproteobacteria bacterium]|nr:type II toxin-antitoxin system RelE/ParE family toxin [Pseudomonadales bacterium]